MNERFKLNFTPAQYGGVLQAVFHDLDGYQCRLRGVDNESITLGLVGPRDFWMMHLDRERAGAIGRALTGFAETSKLGEGREDVAQILQAHIAEIERSQENASRQAYSALERAQSLRDCLAIAIQGLREHDSESKLAEVLERSLDDVGLGARSNKKAARRGIHGAYRNRLGWISAELNDYAYGKDGDGERFSEWEEIATAYAAIERAIERLDK